MAYIPLNLACLASLMGTDTHEVCPRPFKT
nr:MAG TPA: hypothetical protein [Caudoviricetes sp.]DAR22345.1 MAG TPA: hypothetical protein [Caudoviricetes sp.]